MKKSRMMQEIVVMTDKWDVSEEIARLKSHISKIQGYRGRYGIVRTKT